jgi:phage gp29-like protein
MATQIKKQEMTKELGSTGVLVLGGIIQDNEYNKDLIGPEGYRTYEKMRKADSTIKALLLAVKLPIQSTNWSIEPASDDKEDVKRANFIEKQLMENMSRTWTEFVRESLSYLDFGVYVWEQVFESVIFEGQQYIGLHKFSPRLPATVQRWTTTNGEDGITQWTTEKGEVSIPMWKLLILTHEKEAEKWTGTSMLRASYRDYYIKDMLLKINAIKHERQGLGIPYVKREANETGKVTNAEKTKTQEILKNIRANEKGFVDIPGGYEVGFMDMKSSSTTNILESVRYHNREIVKSMLAQFIELGASSTGSYALSEDQSDLFMLCLYAIADYLRDCVQKYVIERLCDLNFAPSENGYPKLKYDAIGKIDFEKLTRALQQMTQAGFTMNDEETEQFMREAMNLPDRPSAKALDDTFVDEITAEAESALAELEASVLEGEVVEDEEDPEAVAAQLEEASELFEGAAGKPLSEEHKRKISEALKKLYGNRGPKPKKGRKAKLSDNPEYQKAQEAITALKTELSDFKDEMRRMVLEKRARGEKFTPEETAKMQLKQMDKAKEIKDKINAQKAVIAGIKSKRSATEVISNSFRLFVESIKDNMKELFHESKSL